MSENNLLSKNSAPHSDVEDIKRRSNYLRGSLTETLKDPITGSIPEDDNRLMKHHGSYMQDDRDLRNERQKQKLEPAYQFMLRVRPRAAWSRRSNGSCWTASPSNIPAVRFA